MSTKTTIKRIALVAVAALGFGMVSVAPSFAGTGFAADNVTVVTPSSSTTVGVAATTVVKLEGICLGAENHNGDYSVQNNIGAWQLILQSVPSGLTSYTAGTLVARATDTTYPYVGAPIVSPAGGNATDAVALACSASGGQTGYATASFTPSKAGTYTFKIKGVFQAYAEASWTVVATAADVTAAAAKTTSFLNAGETTTATADATVSASMALSDTATATIAVTPLNAAGTAATATLTVTVSGPGTVAVGASLAAISALSSGTGRAVTGAAGSYFVGVFADGTAGVSTVTISSGTTVLATETVTFYGAAAKIAPTVVNSVLAIGANAGAITALVTDANGVPVPGVTVYAVSGTDATIDDAYVASTAASDATGKVTFNLTGVAAGTAEIKLTLNSASTGTSTVSAVAGTMRVSDGVPTKVVYAFDKESYAPGEAAKITATVSNAAGVMAAGTHTVLTTALSANFTLAGLPGTLTVASLLSTGVATYTTTIPAGLSGTITLTGVAATGVTATFGSATIVNAAQDVAQAAADAAAEAIDAANAATDAANAAAEAADAATAAAQDAADAVAALSVQVTEQMAELKALNDAQAKAIAALRKQLIALTNLIIKIQKKVKA